MPRLLHLALAQIQPRKGNYAANLARLGEIFAEADRLTPRPDVLQLPETALTGYFVEGGVRDLAVTAGTLARDLDRVYREATGGGRPLDVVVGFYEVFRSTLHNSAMYVTLGGPSGDAAGRGEGGNGAGRNGTGGALVHHVHRKNFLPTYGLFDEERFVERGTEVRAFDAPWGRAALLVCEDAWHSVTGTLAALDGAQVVFVCSAAPARGIWPRDDGIPGPASVGRWERLVRDIAEEHGVFVGLSNLVGSEGGKSFGGASTVVGPKGDVRVRGPLWEEALVSISLDLEDMTRARADSPLLSDLRVALPHLLDTLQRIETGVPAAHAYDPAEASGHDGRGLVRADVGHEEAAGRAQGAFALPQGGLGERAETAERPRGGSAASGGTGARGAPPEHHDAAAPPGRPHQTTAARIQVVRVDDARHGLPPSLAVDCPLLEQWLVHFVRDELRRRHFAKAIVGVSGGVDSAVTAFLAARALGPENVVAVRMPYRTSSPESLQHAQLVIDQLGVESRTVDISAAVDGYLAHEPEADATRRGNVMARMRMIVLFDLSARHRAIPLGTGNKTERLFGYFTWHADDSPPVNPLGDLFKTQVWALARHLGVPDVIVTKPASADLIKGQTDEGDFGISYAKADEVLNWMLFGHTPADLVARGFDAGEVALVQKRLEGTHWKRRMPTVAMVSPTAIGESYLRPVDY